MKITKDALAALLRIVVGCKPPIGKEKRRKNEAHLVACAKQNEDIFFDSFRSGLFDGTQMYDAIAVFAADMKKVDIDLEVILRYFGCLQHAKKTVSELEEANAKHDSIFFLHTLFAHLVIPIEIIEIDMSQRTFTGLYSNDGLQVEVKNVMFFAVDEMHIKKGNIVFSHFPLFVSNGASKQLIDYLLDSQAKDNNFMKAVRCFSERGLDHRKIPMYCKWIEESIERYDL